jgi:hypothetical protein
MWSKGRGWGAKLASSENGLIKSNRWMNLTAYIVFEQDGGTSVALANMAKFSNKLHGWAQLDRDDKGSVFCLAGLTYVYAPNSFVKMFWDEKSDSAQVRLTVSF